MRPSKFRLPDSTDATTRSQSSMAAEISGASGPEFPMQVVQPYPTRLNLSWSRYGVSPASRRYSVTTLDPGASDAFTHGLVPSPRSTAFFATRPAATSTDGFEVFVQLVIAAMTTEPCFSLVSDAAAAVVAGLGPLGAGAPAPSFFFGLMSDGNACSKDFLVANSATRSCGRFGPATLGSTLARSSSSVSV